MENHGQSLEGNLVLKQQDPSDPKCRLLFFPYNRSGGVADGPEFSSFQVLLQKINQQPFNLSIYTRIPFQIPGVTGIKETFHVEEQLNILRIDFFHSDSDGF
jgi:hypothetical protein